MHIFKEREKKGRMANFFPKVFLIFEKWTKKMSKNENSKKLLEKNLPSFLLTIKKN